LVCQWVYEKAVLMASDLVAMTAASLGLTKVVLMANDLVVMKVYCLVG